MNRSSTNKGFPTKKEGDDDDSNSPRGPSSSRPWSGLKDPRIVRVSRTFGGKDRHSKVCTIRGLRDRRVRLSVPTAIQLYDLQDRLGLNQPSKVVDWLLSAAQDDIDKLPPLQMHPEQFLQYPQPVLVSHEATPLSISVVGAKSDVYERSSGADLLSSKGNAKGSNDEFRADEMSFPKSTYWNSDAPSRAKCKEVRGEMTSVNARSNWMKRNEHQNQDGSHQDHHGAPQVLPVHNSFPRPNLSSIPNLLNNAIPYTSYYHWDLPSNSSVPHLSGHGYPSQIEEAHNFNSISMPPSLSLPSGSQLLLYPSGTTPSIFPQYVSTPAEGDPRQISHFQLLSSATQNLLANPITSLYSINPTMRPFQVNITPMYHDFQNSHGSQQNALHETSTATTSAVTTSSFQNDSKDATLGSNPSSFM